MTTTQAAAWLKARGLDLKPDTIKHHCAAGSLPAGRPGRDWEISEADLQQFLTTYQGPGRRWPPKEDE